MEGAWKAASESLQEFESAWNAGAQATAWAEEFDEDAARKARDAPLEDPDAMSWVAQYNASLDEPHRAQPLGSLADRLIGELGLTSLGPDAGLVGRKQAEVEAAVLSGPLPERLESLIAHRCRVGDAPGALLAVNKLVELGVASERVLRPFLLSCASDLAPQDVLRFVGPALLGAQIVPGAPVPCSNDVIAALVDLVGTGGARENDPGAHVALGLVMDRACDRPGLALQHYDRARALLLEAPTAAATDAAAVGALVALAAVAEGRPDEIDTALRFAPGSATVWAALALRLAGSEEWATAARCALRAAVAAGPEVGRHWDGLAIVLCALGRDDLAHIALLGRERLVMAGSDDVASLEAEILGELRRMGGGA